MNKEAFAQRMACIKQEEQDLNREKTELVDSYITENREFEDGELVRVINANRPEKNRFVYIKGAEVYEDGTITYDCLKSKKDGTKAKTRDYIDNKYSKSEKLEKIIINS